MRAGEGLPGIGYVSADARYPGGGPDPLPRRVKGALWRALFRVFPPARWMVVGRAELRRLEALRNVGL